jgi:hypothetical protein
VKKLVLEQALQKIHRCFRDERYDSKMLRIEKHTVTGNSRKDLICKMKMICEVRRHVPGLHVIVDITLLLLFARWRGWVCLVSLRTVPGTSGTVEREGAASYVRYLAPGHAGVVYTT